MTAGAPLLFAALGGDAEKLATLRFADRRAGNRDDFGLNGSHAVFNEEQVAGAHLVAGFGLVAIASHFAGVAHRFGDGTALHQAGLFEKKIKAHRMKGAGRKLLLFC